MPPGHARRPGLGHRLTRETQVDVVRARPVVSGDLGRRVHQRHVAECLGEVAHQPTGHRVVLLGEQSQIVAKVEQALEELAGVVLPPEQRQAVGQPERAGQERTLATGQAVDLTGVGRSVAEDEVAFHQLPLDGLHGGPDPWIGGRQEADQRDHQQAGIEAIRPVVLRERALGGVEPLVTHLVMDLLADLAPPLHRSVGSEVLDRSDRPVERHPGHDLGVGEVPAGTPDLPDPVVRLPPPGLQEREQ